MKVVHLSELNQAKLQEFVKTITVGETRPVLYIGLDQSGDPVLHTGDMTWKELGYVKLCLDMHFVQDYFKLQE